MHMGVARALPFSCPPTSQPLSPKMLDLFEVWLVGALGDNLA